MAKARKRTPAKQSGHTAEAIHVRGDDEEHFVGFKSLRVMLVPDAGQWFAQGLDLDYASSGATIEEAKQNFENGLSMTVARHLSTYGSIDELLKLAPAEAWTEYSHASPETVKQTYTTIEGYKIVEKARQVSDVDDQLPESIFPFDKVLYFRPFTPAK